MSTTQASAFHHPPICAQTNTRQNGTRCREYVKVLSCCSHLVCLVFKGSIPTCACLHSENLFATLVYSKASPWPSILDTFSKNMSNTNQYDIYTSVLHGTINLLVKRHLSALLMLFASLTSQTFSVAQHRLLSVCTENKSVVCMERKGSGLRDYLFAYLLQSEGTLSSLHVHHELIVHIHPCSLCTVRLHSLACSGKMHEV